MAIVRTLLLAVLSIPAGACAAEPAFRWQPEEFVISYWCGPPAEFTTLERYQEIKDANFTYAFPIYGGATAEQTTRQLDLCQRVGLKAFIHDPRLSGEFSETREAEIDAMVKEFGSHPALAGYSIADEPGGASFEPLGKAVASLRAKDPRHPGYINLLPTYAREHGDMLGYPTYEEYVRKYVEIVDPFVISYDHYHFTESGDRVDFWENLATVRMVAGESGLHFWNIVLVTQHFAYRHLREPELRFEAMQTLAYGGKGLIWFTYWSPAAFDTTAHWAHAMIGADGTRDSHYEMVKEINADVLAMGSQLLTATSTDVYHIGTILPFCAAASADAAVKSTDDVELTVGIFRSQEGREFACVANRDYEQSAKFEATFPTDQTEVFDRDERTWLPLDAGSLELAAGDAVLVRW